MQWEDAVANSRLQACGFYDEKGTFWYLAIEEDKEGNKGPVVYYKRKNQKRLRQCHMLPTDMNSWEPIGGPPKQKDTDA